MFTVELSYFCFIITTLDFFLRLTEEVITTDVAIMSNNILRLSTITQTDIDPICYVCENKGFGRHRI